MTTELSSRYGPWGIVAGGSDGLGVACAHTMAARGVNVVLVARRLPVLEASAAEIESRYGVAVQILALDLTTEDAIAELDRATADLEVGIFVYNAGSDDQTSDFLDRDLASHLKLVQRNCSGVLEAAYRFGAPMVARGRGALVLINSAAAWVGRATIASYGATKAFDLVLAEGLWAEWHERGVDVLTPVLGVTDTPSLRRTLDDAVLAQLKIADPHDVAVEMFDHLSDGPTWIVGSDNPGGGSPFGALDRRDAVLLMGQSFTASDID